jgi:hypothetical protein
MLKPIYISLFLGLSVIPAQAVCKPKTISNVLVKSQVIAAQVKYKNSTYSLAKITGRRPNEVFSVIYREKKGECYLSFADPGGEAYSLSEGVPRPVAISFAKQSIKAYISRFGQAKLIQKYNALPSIAPEDAEALKELGIPLSTGVKVNPWATPQPEERIKS